MQARYRRFFQTGKVDQGQLLNGIFYGIELVLVDIDGTVLDQTIPHYRKHLNQARHGVTAKQHWSHDEFLLFRKRTFEQHGTDWISHRHMIADMIEIYDENHESVELGMRIFYDSFALDTFTPPLFPSLRELLENLKNNQLPVLAFSNNDHYLIQTMLTNHRVHDQFHAIVGDTNKPKPDVLHEVLRQHPELPQTTGEHVLVIGDSLATDGELAKNIGAKFVYFTGGFEQEDKKRSYQAVKQKQQEQRIPLQTVIIDDFSMLQLELKKVNHAFV